jgi:hypothetical protein
MGGRKNLDKLKHATASLSFSEHTKKVCGNVELNLNCGKVRILITGLRGEWYMQHQRTS